MRRQVEDRREIGAAAEQGRDRVIGAGDVDFQRNPRMLAGQGFDDARQKPFTWLSIATSLTCP
jgi:hypothetical protein